MSKLTNLFHLPKTEKKKRGRSVTFTSQVTAQSHVVGDAVAADTEEGRWC